MIRKFTVDWWRALDSNEKLRYYDLALKVTEFTVYFYYYFWFVFDQLGLLLWN